jgi:hypothetical protein
METSMFPSRKYGNQYVPVQKIWKPVCSRPEKWLAIISVPKYNRHYRRERREYYLGA